MYKKDFPIFSTHPDLVYLDSASSAQKPWVVIDGMSQFFSSSYANIHRGAYDLSVDASDLYDRSKSIIARHLGVTSHEITYTYNATYAFNLIARLLIENQILVPGDHVLLSLVEHHANIVPWQILARDHGIIIDWVWVHDDGTIDYSDIESQIAQAKVVSLTWASNVTGEILDIARVRTMIDALISPPLLIIDGSQRFPHMDTDMSTLGIDIFVATGHKVMADTGIGFFAMRKSLLQSLSPVFSGGGAINEVRTDGFDPAGLPWRHEPGTPHIAGAVSILSALEYIEYIWGLAPIETYERTLVEYALTRIVSLPSSIRLIGSRSPEGRLWVFSFSFATHHPNDIGEYMADRHIAVRAGRHCTDPLHTRLGIGGTLRMSLYLYNTIEDIDRFFDTLEEAVAV
jgi:cysteine desulfurase / selenocysteine lyase